MLMFIISTVVLGLAQGVGKGARKRNPYDRRKAPLKEAAKNGFFRR